MSRNLRIFVFFALLLSVFSLECCFAQSPEDRILSAETSYNNGFFQVCRDSMSVLLKENKEKVYRWQALRLLALSELSLNRLSEARIATRNMLDLNPRYRPSSYKDPQEWAAMLKENAPFPLLGFGLWLSPLAMFNEILVDKNYFVETGNELYESDRTNAFGIELELRPWRNWSLSTGVSASQVRWSSIQLPDAEERRVRNHNSWYLEVPAYLRFRIISKSKVQLFMETGVSFHRSLSQSISLYNYRSNVLVNSLERFDIGDLRFPFFMSAGIGGGLSASLGPGAITFTFRWQEGLTQINRPESRYAILDLRDYQRYVEDDFRLRQYFIQIGYQFPLAFKTGGRKR